MHGFITIISLQEKIIPISIHWKEIFDFQTNHIHRKSESSNYQIEQFTSDKFISDKLWIDNDDFFICTDGIILNSQILFQKHKAKDFSNLIYKLTAKKENFFTDFEGNFVGVFFNKRTNTWLAFNNQAGTQKLYYYKQNDFLIFSTDLYTLCQSIKLLGYTISLDIAASYLLLTNGFMHENSTLIQEVKQLRAGEYCEYKSEIFNVSSYYNLNQINENKDSKKTIIETLDYKFKEAINLEFEKDKEFNYQSLTTLSGGLDSRMTALIANKMGFTNQILLNFSDKGYADEIIARKIAKTYELEMIQLSLSAQSLKAIDDVVLVNDGLTTYSACSHAFSALKQIQGTNTGILHTGMIGDAVMGSFVSKIEVCKPKLNDGLYSVSLLNKAKSTISKSLLNYPTEELYKFYNRAFLGANNGFQYFNLISEGSSPFLNSDFLSYAYSIPRRYKYKENIYIDWIKTLHPDIAKFTWESIGGKPTNNQYLRSYYRYKRAIIKRLPIGSMWKNNMNPEQLWYDKNMNVKTTLDNYFHEYLHLLDNELELQNDIIRLYNTGNITEKTQVLTLLAGIKLLF